MKRVQDTTTTRGGHNVRINKTDTPSGGTTRTRDGAKSNYPRGEDDRRGEIATSTAIIFTIDIQHIKTPFSRRRGETGKAVWARVLVSSTPPSTRTSDVTTTDRCRPSSTASHSRRRRRRGLLFVSPHSHSNYYYHNYYFHYYYYYHNCYYYKRDFDPLFIYVYTAHVYYMSHDRLRRDNELLHEPSLTCAINVTPGSCFFFFTFFCYLFLLLSFFRYLFPYNTQYGAVLTT